MENNKMKSTHSIATGRYKVVTVQNPKGSAVISTNTLDLSKVKITIVNNLANETTTMMFDEAASELLAEAFAKYYGTDTANNPV